MLVVDAANVVGSRPDGWWHDRAGAAGRLVDRLRRAVGAGILAAPVVVVLEGAARAGAVEGTSGDVTVVHAAGSGDDRIVELASAAQDDVLVVTADRALGVRVRAVAGDVVGPSWLLDRLP